MLETTPQQLSTRIEGDGDFAFVARQLAPETAERALALGIQGLNEQNEYRRYYPGGEVTAQIDRLHRRPATRARKASSSRSRRGSAARRAAGA